MKRAIILLAILIVGLLTSVFSECITVEAQVEQLSVELSPSPTTVSVNQVVEITANVTNGTPPYTYYWFTDFIPQDDVQKLGSPENPLLVLLMTFDSRAVQFKAPVSYSPTFDFVKTTPGYYVVLVHVSDSQGVTGAKFLSSFILVSNSPIPTPSPSPPLPNVFATIDNGTYVNLPISGNVSSSQITDATITTNQSAISTKLSFTLKGTSGDFGFSNITIPKSVVAFGGAAPTIYVDNQSAQSQGYIQDDSNYYVWFTTHFSAHEIAIVFTTTSPMPDASNDILSGLTLVQVVILFVMTLIVIVTVFVFVKVLRSRSDRR